MNQASLDGIGTLGLLKAHTGKEISCDGWAFAKVDASGNLFTRAVGFPYYGSDSGWVAGNTASTSDAIGSYTAKASITGVSGTSTTCMMGCSTSSCTAPWP